MYRNCIFPTALVLLAALAAHAPAAPNEWDKIDAAVNEAIKRNELPGAVVLVLHKGQVVYRKAHGHRAKQPAETAMPPDAIFDLASLTKPIATATSIMLLVEQGKLKLTDPVAKYIPEFGAKGKDKITIEHLLLHTSGLSPVSPEADYLEGRAKALERIYQRAPAADPGARFIYSDLGYIVLGELVGEVTIALEYFSWNEVFQPLRMRDTRFHPYNRDWFGPIDPFPARIAPTEKRGERWVVGEVHDPRAFRLGGAAGHAGLFGTADDLAIYARMILGGGEVNGKRILKPKTVRLMTTPRPVPGGLRALGWDVQTSYSSNRGTRFPAGKSFGHTGFTGTSIWIDPGSETAVIFLSNRVHPNGKGNVNKLRGQVATLAAAALGVGESCPVLTGIDVLVRDQFVPLKGRRVGLVTNHTGRDRAGRATIDLLHQAEGVKLAALFSPEHGIRGALDAKVPDTKDEKTGLPVWSLYGDRRKPTADTLQGLDTLVFDIQDAGCRFYTYISTLGLVMEAAAENKLRVVVLDRPNPIGGVAVAGPVRDPGRGSFVAYHDLPIRHGMTVGELARLYNAERKLGVELEVIKLEGWRRGDFYDRTNLTWVNPSPNLRGLTAAFLYPGVGLLETTNLSVGRGTDRPFEWIGAPWLDGQRLAAELAKQDLPGVRFVPARLTPSSSTHQGKECGGVQIIVDDWGRFEPLRTGLTVAVVLRQLFPGAWQLDRYDTLLVHKATWEALKRGAGWGEIEKLWETDLRKFREVRSKYLLYPE